MWRAGRAVMLALILAGCTTAGGKPPVGTPQPAPGAAPAPARPGADAPSTAPGSVAIKPPVPIAVSPTGDWVATGLDGLTLVDRTGTASHPLQAANQVRQLSWSPTGDWLVAGADRGQVLLLHPADGSKLDLSDKLTGLAEGRLLTAWAPDGSRLLVTAEILGGVPIWEVTLPAGAVRKVADASRVVGLSSLQGDKALLLQAAGCCGAQAGTLDLQTGIIADMGHHGSYAVAPNGRFLAEAPYMGGEVTLHDLTTGEQTRSGESYDSAAPRHADGSAGEYRAWVHSFSPDSRLFAFSVTEGAKQTLHVLDPTWEYQPRKMDDWAGSLVWLGKERDFLYDTHAGDGIAVHLNGTPLATHAGGKHLGLSGDHPEAALSRDGLRLAYTVELADRRSLLIVADLTTGEVRTLPDSTGLLPLMWTADGAGLVVAEMAFTRDDLHGGGSAEGWRLRKTRTVPTAGGEVLVPSKVSAGWTADKPLWGEPGTSVYEAVLPDSPRLLSQVLAPLTFRGQTLQPVFTGQGTHFLRQAGAVVYSDGYITLAGTLAVLEKPRLLYRLPLTLGATFTLEYQHHNFGTTFWTYRVAGFETVSTPAGEREAVLLESERGQMRDWWVPGIGRVRINETTAARIETGKPVALGVAARLDERTTGFLVGSLQVQDQDGTVLLDESINPYRSQVWWADGGAPAPIVLHFTHSQAEPNLTYGGYVYQRATHSFALIRWRLPDGRTKTALAGDLQQVEGQAAIRLRDDEHYPLFSECLFRWDGERMACSRYTAGTPARDEADLARDLTRPLDEESWARIFRNPEAGRAAYRATRTEEGRNRLAYQTPRTDGDGSWVFTPPGLKVRFTIVHEGDAWLIATWRIE